MKIFPLLLSLCLPAAFAFASGGAEPSANSAPPPVPAAARKDIACDFFNFDAMRKSVPAGKALYDFIFSGKDDAAGALIRKLNADYGMRLPQTLDSLSVTKIFSNGAPAMNLAIAKFRPDGKDNSAKHFISELKKRAANSTPQTQETPGQDFPEDLSRLLPPDFRGNAERICADAVENELSVFAWFPESSEIGNTPEENEFLTAKLSEFENLANEPGVLIFRAFPRREPPKNADEKFCLSIPAGEFLLSEENSCVKIAIAFHCIDETETENMLHFFALFKANLFAAAKGFAPAEIAALKDIAGTVSISKTADGMKVALLCPAENFPALLKWHGVRFPKPPRKPEKF